MATTVAELPRFCAELGIDEDRAREVLAEERGKLTSALATPWYVRLVVGAGAWVTAIAAIALGVAIVFLIKPNSPEILLFVLGAAYIGAGLLLLRKAERSVFASQLGAAIAAAGTAMIAAATLFEFEGRPWPAFLASAAVTAIIVFTTANRTLEFLASLLTAIFFVVAILNPLGDFHVPYYRDIIALSGIGGVILMLSPPRRDLRPIAVVLLLVFPIFDWFSADYFFMFGASASTAGGLLAKLLYIGLFLWLAAIHWQRVAAPDVRTRLMVFGVAAVIVGLLLPAGGTAALMIMMLAFVLGSRPLALLGTLLEINYIWRFYYDIEVTLLVKSGILVAVGAALLIAWWLMMRRVADGARI